MAGTTEQEKALREVIRDLQLVPDEYKSDRATILAAVRSNGLSLRFVSDECRSDREIVLAAVEQNGRALQYASDECKKEKEVVLAAVKQKGYALEFAADTCKGDSEIVLAAVQDDVNALDFAAEDLLLDSAFAPEAKGRCFILRISMLSGRYTHIVSETQDPDRASFILDCCCTMLGIDRRGAEVLIHGSEVVADDAFVRDWPGIQPPGEVSEYQLVAATSPPADAW